MPGWLSAATVAASRWKRWRKLGSLEYWSERTLIATGISRRGGVGRVNTPLAARGRAGSVGARPSRVVLTLSLWGWPDARPRRGDLPRWRAAQQDKTASGR